MTLVCQKTAKRGETLEECSYELSTRTVSRQTNTGRTRGAQRDFRRVSGVLGQNAVACLTPTPNADDTTLAFFRRARLPPPPSVL